MPSNEKILRVTLKLQDEMSKELEKSANSLKKLGNDLTSIGQKMTAGLTLPIIGAGAAMAKNFADFDAILTEIQVRSGATAEEMNKIRDAAIEFGRTTTFSSTEAAAAMQELEASGMGVTDILLTAEHAINLATAGNIELAQATDDLTNIIKSFGLETEDAAGVVDQLTKAAGASSATVDELTDSFANLGPIAKQFGLSVADTNAVFGVFSDVGIKGAEAGTQLRSMLLNMSRVTPEVTAAWEELGVSLYDTEGNIRNLDDVFKDINKAMADMSLEDQNRLAAQLAGSYGLIGFQALRATDGFSAMRDAMHKEAGAAEVAAAMNSTLAAKLDMMGNAFQTLGVIMGGLAEGPIISLVESVTWLVNEFGKWAEANPALAQTVMIILAIIAAIGPLLIIIGQMAAGWAALATAFPAIIGAFTALKLAIVGFGAAVIPALLPFLPIIIAIVAAALLLWAVATNFMGIRDIIVNAVFSMIDAIGQWLAAWWDAIQQVPTILGQLAVLAVEGIKRAVMQAGVAFSQIGQIIWARLQTLGSQMFTLGQVVITSLIKGIASKAVDLLAYVFGLSKELTQMIKTALGIASPSKVMMGLGENVVQGFQKGMDNLGGLDVGVTANGRPVSSASPSLAMAGSGGGGYGNVTINVYPTQADPRKVAEEVDKILGKKMMRKGARK